MPTCTCLWSNTLPACQAGCAVCFAGGHRTDRVPIHNCGGFNSPSGCGPLPPVYLGGCPPLDVPFPHGYAPLGYDLGLGSCPTLVPEIRGVECPNDWKAYCLCSSAAGNLGPFSSANKGVAVQCAECTYRSTNLGTVSAIEVEVGTDCYGSTGACCREGTSTFSCISTSVCNCAAYANGLGGWIDAKYYAGKSCSEIQCATSKRCCHCDWCCKVGSGGITETACTQAGGLVQNGTCPASGSCTTTNCKPCLLSPFELAVNRTGNSQSVAGGYQPIARIKAIDTTASVEADRVMHASFASVGEQVGRYGYAAQSCNIYNRFLGGGNRLANTLGSDVTRRQAVSECALSAVQGGYGYAFNCPYREPCSELPAGCTREAA